MTIAPGKYHVFLSFRGKDTRKGFTDHLHAALQRRGIITFLDEDSLNRGEVISDQLLQAIDDSPVSLVVLSEGYASSSWCLDELQRILKSRKTYGREVIPIFYKIDPSDVRHHRGSFDPARVLQKDGDRFAEEKVQRWKDALEEVANISGYDSRDWYEAELVEEISQDVWAKVHSKLPYCFSNELVGIEAKIKRVESLLKIGSDNGPQFLEIGGMGGIGKTTLARVFFERNCGHFDISCFLANVEEKSKTDQGLVDLQRQLLSQLKIRDLEVHDKYDGKKGIIELLWNTKLLLVLDDVSEKSQLEYLPIHQARLGCGSRVIVTTRSYRVLEKLGKFEIYRAEILNYNESRQLLCMNAFERDEPEEGYEELCKSVIEYAAGLPLALKVVGSTFWGKSELQWKAHLEKFKKSPPKGILESLRVSYDAVDEEEKKTFLDIACFFKGRVKDEVTQIFEICDLNQIAAIGELVTKCLITEYDSDHGTCLGMHDLLQEMGKTIVLEESPDDPGRRSRLWSLEDIDHVMTKNKGSEKLEVIHLQSSTPYHSNWDPEVFSMMRKLRILIIACDVHLPHGLKCLPSSLKILEWKSYPLNSLPSGENLDQLGVIKMHHSKILQLWKRTHSLEKLKFIDLSYSEDFSTTPDFSMLPNLEQLVLEGCIKLVEVHPSLAQHKKLVELDFKDCKNLKAVPARMDMDSLNKLILSGCLKIKELPEFGKNMSNLLVLDVKNCKNLDFLPSSICNLKSLKILNMFGCSKFSSLPENLNENMCLEELDLRETAVREFSSSITGLQNLKLLYLSGCKGLSSRPNSLERRCLSQVQEVSRLHNESPTSSMCLPFIPCAESLKVLHLDYCNLKAGSISFLSCAASLEYLSLGGNDFGNASNGNWVLPPSLKYLYLSKCNLNDSSIPNDLNSLSALETLSLSENNFTHIPAGCISNLLHLHTLHLSHCPRLKFLPDLPPNLQCIDTVACDLITLSFPEMLLKCIAFANVSVEPISHMDANNIRFGIWWTLGGKIPSWFHHQDFQVLDKIDRFQDKHVVQTSVEEISNQSFDDIENDAFIQADSIVSMEVDITDFRGSSDSWGISLCVVLQDMNLDDVFDLDLKMTHKASEDEFFKKEMRWGVKFERHSHQILTMYLSSGNLAVACNKVEFIFYTTKSMRADMEAELDMKADCGGHGKFIISKCGWRVTRKEDVEEWLRTIQQGSSTSDNNKILSQESVHGKRPREGEEDLQQEVTVNEKLSARQ
ncbi:hypothetical protein K1719_026450 [Acacia pycnantha]|nr:hypothetical protein K1719_026450 [Acacia pycnantha]